MLWWSEVKINHTTWFSGLDLVRKRCDWRKIPQKIFAQNFKIGPKWQKLKFWAKFFCGIFLQEPLFPTKSRPGNHVVWFILTSDHHKMPKQEQNVSKMLKLMIFDDFCLITWKLIFFTSFWWFFWNLRAEIRYIRYFLENLVRQNETCADRSILERRV